MTPHIRRLIDFLAAAGAGSPRVEQHGRHPRLVFTWQGVERRHAVAGSLGDGAHGTQNALSELRHMLGLVDREKRIGERRRRRRSSPRREPASLVLSAAPASDWKDDLARIAIQHDESARH